MHATRRHENLVGHVGWAAQRIDDEIACVPRSRARAHQAKACEIKRARVPEAVQMITRNLVQQRRIVRRCVLDVRAIPLRDFVFALQAPT